MKATRAKAKEIRKKITEEGPESVYGAESGRLVLKVMQLEEKMKAAERLIAEDAEGNQNNDNGSP